MACMSDEQTDAACARECVDERREWLRPSVQKIRAGDAELGTREDVADGGFTTS